MDTGGMEALRLPDADWILATGLVTVRLGSIALVAPPLGGRLVPAQIRLAMILALSVVLATSGPIAIAGSYSWFLSYPGHLLAAVATEAALGAFMACGLNIAFAITTFAGRLLDVQVGFGIGQVFDPMTRQQLPVLGAIFNQMALVMFFVLDGHHAFMRGLMFSLEAVPPGTLWDLNEGLAALARQAGQLFSLGFAMAAPLVFGLMLVELGLGVLARNLPQMNTLILGVPIKVVVAMLLLSIWVGGSSTIVSQAYYTAFAMWGGLWR